MIKVFLTSRHSSAWKQVREVEGQMADRFPGSGVNIRLIEQQPEA